MKFVQIVFSPTGGTKKVADTIMDEWKAPMEMIDLSDGRTDFAAADLKDYDLALIAVPSFGGRVPALAAERLSQIHGNQTLCVVVCVYGNRAYEDTLLELSDVAEQCGFQVIAGISAVAEHSIMHEYASGRPDEQDQNDLRNFARRIMEKIQTDPERRSAFQIPGNRPYKKAGGAAMIPRANHNCTSCGLCAQKCPAQAISGDNPRETDSRKCISCMRCVSLCPQKARKVNRAMVAAASLAMKKVCSERKNNELFC